MSFGRTCTGVYSTENLLECVDTFRRILLPAAALRASKSRSKRLYELEFHRQQCLEIIDSSEVLAETKEKLKLSVDSKYKKVLEWIGVENA
jgi:hypothetical protein